MNRAGDAIADTRGLLLDLRRPCRVLIRDGRVTGLSGGTTGAAGEVVALPPLPPEHLGSAAFRADHGTRFALMAGAMAGGIASVELVRALAEAGFAASFGAAGLPLADTLAAVDTLRRSVPGRPWAVNVIHRPDSPEAEDALVDALLAAGVETVEASAFMDLAPSLVRFRAAGLDGGGQGRPRTRLVVKLSNPELAARFMAPPPVALLDALAGAGRITRAQAALAATLPLAGDVTVEADSGGHTDGRPLVCLLPMVLRLRDAAARSLPGAQPVRIGAAGGIATPEAAAAAFAMGADYVVTGSVNQSCVEAGTSDLVKRMLATVGWGDLSMAPAADMFELGAQVQVVQKGTLFAGRARRLRRLYQDCAGLEDLSPADRQWLERDVLRQPAEAAWTETAAYLAGRDPAMLERARQDRKLRMALVFRGYLGLSSRWAVAGRAERGVDFQIWCGPAMAAFNAWAAGSRFERPEARRAVPVNEAIMTGAAYLLRLGWLRAHGAVPGPELTAIGPDDCLETPSQSPASSPARTPAQTEKRIMDADDIRSFLTTEIAQRLSLSEDEIDPAATFETFSIDSATAMLVMARLEKRLGRRLSATLIWNYPTIDALAARLAEPVAGGVA